ncbi:hypothetical protein [Pseudonocardia sp. GCM10023141]|uniref:hypothetical protein n=1 Tax=Pseudonocardia sp. GCM10023141 TaxID=3252653 RepID=UPI00360F6AF9
MADDQPVSERVEALARLIARDVDTLADEELVELIRTWTELRKAGPDRIGRAIATLYQRDRLSWPEISRLTGVPAMTAHDWARPHLLPDSGTELGPRRGRTRPTE